MKLRRIVGPPGCGKTTFLAGEAKRYASMVGETNVLISSLTRAAAAEVAGRDSGVVGSNVGTLHSHAYRALRAAGLANNPIIADSPLGVKEWNRICPREFTMTEQAKIRDTDDLYGDAIGGDHVADAILSDYVILRQQMVPADEWPENIKKFAGHWESFKRDNEMIDFTDMIEICVRERLQPRRHVEVVFVDEAQDLSRLEYSLVASWGAEAREVVIVGDPDQNLYEWRGSDPQAFYEHSAEEMRVLEQSYRVPRAVHERAVRFIELTPYREPVVYHPRDADGAVHREHIGTWTEPGLLAEVLLEHHERGETAMILASCKFMLNRVVSYLRAEGIPFHNPYRRKDGTWNPLHITKMPERVLALLRPQRDVWDDAARMWTMREIKLIAEDFRTECFAKRGVKTWVRDINDRDNRTATFEALMKLFPERVMTALYDGDIGAWQQFLSADQRRVSEFTVQVATSRGARTLREEPRIVVGTIHSVKGGEADHVYLWPDVSSAAAQHFYDRRSPDAATIRTFYVGMTRAKQALHLLPPVPRGYHVEL